MERYRNILSARKTQKDGITQKDLAGIIGISVGDLSKIERGKKALSPVIQEYIEKALDCILVRPLIPTPSRKTKKQQNQREKTAYRSRMVEHTFVLLEFVDKYLELWKIQADTKQRRENIEMHKKMHKKIELCIDRQIGQE